TRQTQETDDISTRSRSRWPLHETSKAANVISPCLMERQLRTLVLWCQLQKCGRLDAFTPKLRHLVNVEVSHEKPRTRCDGDTRWRRDLGVRSAIRRDDCPAESAAGRSRRRDRRQPVGRKAAGGGDGERRLVPHIRWRRELPASGCISHAVCRRC